MEIKTKYITATNKHQNYSRFTIHKSASMEAARNLLLLFLWRLRLGLTLCLRNQALGHLHMLFVRLHVLVSLGSMCG